MRTVALLLALSLTASARAEIDVPSDGSDGDFVTDVATKEIVIDLAKAPTGRWDTPQTEPLQPEIGGVGIYDPEKWAVVFKYNRVRIEHNVTLKFLNHPSRAPVVWLVKGDAEIYGQVNLDGKQGVWHEDSGPGGFRGSHSPERDNQFRGYLNLPERSRWSPNLVPLHGGYGNHANAGAGAILIASRQRIVLDGQIQARGQGAQGGAVRLVADELAGSGFIDIRNSLSPGGPHGVGRLEAHRFTGSLRASFNTTIVSPEPLRLWPEPDGPTVRIVSVEGAEAPSDPRARLDAEAGPGGVPLGADMTIAKSGPSKVLIETTNLEPSPDARVMLFVSPNSGRIRGGSNGYADYDPLRATLVTGGTFARAQWLVELELPPGYTSLQVHAVGP